MSERGEGETSPLSPLLHAAVLIDSLYQAGMRASPNLPGLCYLASPRTGAIKEGHSTTGVQEWLDTQVRV